MNRRLKQIPIESLWHLYGAVQADLEHYRAMNLFQRLPHAATINALHMRQRQIRAELHRRERLNGR
jgi:hypothetical protein